MMEEKPMEENLTQENQTETKKRRGWLIPAVIAAVVAAAAIGAAVYFLTRWDRGRWTASTSACQAT